MFNTSDSSKGESKMKKEEINVDELAEATAELLRLGYTEEAVKQMLREAFKRAFGDGK